MLIMSVYTYFKSVFIITELDVTTLSGGFLGDTEKFKSQDKTLLWKSIFSSGLVYSLFPKIWPAGT